MVTRDIHLTQISSVMGIEYNELRALNPQYRTGLIPGRTKPSSLTLPMDNVGEFIYLHDTIQAYKANVYLAKTNNSTNPASSSFSAPDIKGKSKLIYTVKSGDNLGFISEWYRVPLSELKYWNNIRSNTIVVGQKITVYVDPAKVDQYSKINAMAFAEKQKSIGKPAGISTSTSTTPSPSPPSGTGEFEYYTVRYGDNVWDIAKKFSDVSVEDILALNNLSSSGKIQVGQKLKIRKK
jgi:membrane-bound lytic murein transglycosylase D